MKTFTLEEIKKIVKREKLKHVGLFKIDGTPLLRMNTNTVKVETQLTKIDERLKSQLLADGIYIIKAKYLLNVKDEQPAEFAVQKGAASLSENHTNHQTVEIRSFEAALADQVKLIKLDSENNLLKEKLAALERELTEARSNPPEEEEEEEEEEGTLSEPQAPSWLQQMLQIATPLLDKHFELKQRTIELEESREKQRQAQNDKPINTGGIDSLFKKLKIWINRQPEETEYLMELYQDSENMDDFFNNLIDERPDLADSLKKYLAE